MHIGLKISKELHDYICYISKIKSKNIFICTLAYWLKCFPDRNIMTWVQYINNKFSMILFTHTSLVPFINQCHVGGSFAWLNKAWRCSVSVPANCCFLHDADFTLGREFWWSVYFLSFHKPNWLCLFSIFQFLLKKCFFL